MTRTRSSTNRLYQLYATGKYICTHRLYNSPNKTFHTSYLDLPLSYPHMEVKLIKKVSK